MRLSHMCARLRADMARARWQAQFEAAREREPALAAYAGIEGVADALELDGDESFDVRAELVSALLRENRRCCSQFWASVLLVAFRPMLLQLRAQIGECVLESSDVDQVVVEGFLTAVRKPHGATNLGALLMRVRLQTRRCVFQFIRAERVRLLRQQQAEQVAFTLSTNEYWLREADVRTALVENTILASALSDVVDEQLSERQFEMIAAAWLTHTPLRTHLSRAAHGAPVNEATYQRVKRERSRVLRKLRPLMQARVQGPSSNESRPNVELGRAV